MMVEIKHFSALTLGDFHDLISLRIAVFVVEQNCPYQELDGKDRDAYHLIVRDPEAGIIGTLRILKPGVSYNEVSIGRVASHPLHRTKKLGHRMMQEAMAFIRSTMKNPDIRISAQSHLCRFYETCGFNSTGKTYLEDDIPHTEMLFRAPKP